MAMWRLPEMFVYGCMCAFSMYSLEAVRREKNDIQVMIVDTNKSANASLLGKPFIVDNPGAGQTWEGWKTKNCLSRDYMAQIARESPDTLVVAVDGGDVLYGGCDEVIFRARYDQIVSASGGKRVVLGGEFGAWPNSYAKLKPRYEPMEKTRSKVMRAAGLDPEVYEKYLGECLLEYCGGHPSYEFANGGFKVGPAQDLHMLFDTLCNTDDDEQEALHELLLAGKQSLTIDYTGVLVLALYGFEYTKVLSVYSNGVYNRATNSSQCFVHGNGEAKAAVLRLDTELKFRAGSLIEAGHVRKNMKGAPVLMELESTPLRLLH
eukprot:TRINITY_DN8567_c0_g1_i1.p1 TRINITY_DN8567_c0_g1~~TRINITY_DN8567_c0_g1_i1.p1  ORF type:complete len:320 (+),score=46.28 TRINITY_DN8567_c0_g1_i1:53-1012(+)